MHFTRRSMLALSAAVTTIAVIPNISRAKSQDRVYAERGIAIDGTDPVAYFTQSKPVAGDPAISHDWMGATWRFSSAANRAAFVADPTAYAPQFGGYCSWAVSQGYTASTTPEAWKIVDGKLYLNYSKRVQKRWARDVLANIASGQANWPNVLE